jgi:glutathione S-transferase
MMRLYYGPQSPYARKCRIIIHELNMKQIVDEIVARPRDPDVRAINPLGKIPALVLDDNSVVYDSPVICEFLDQRGGGKFIPRDSMFSEAKGKWRALTLQALGDGLAEITSLRNAELRRPESQRSAESIARHATSIGATLAVLERVAEKAGERWTIGEIAIACSLTYFDMRFPDEGWRKTHPALDAWFTSVSAYPSMVATAPSQQ